MSAPLVLAVPAKGRLQENAEAFFARAGLALIKPRGARDYRGAVAGLDGVRARLRLLHRLRVRADRSGAHRRSAGWRRPL